MLLCIGKPVELAFKENLVRVTVEAMTPQADSLPKPVGDAQVSSTTVEETMEEESLDGSTVLEAQSCETSVVGDFHSGTHIIQGEYSQRVSAHHKQPALSSCPPSVPLVGSSAMLTSQPSSFSDTGDSPGSLLPQDPVYVKDYAAAGESAVDGRRCQRSTRLFTEHEPIGGFNAQVEYASDSQWIEIWFRNECRPVSGLTLWGSYTYGRWWKGIAACYVRTGSVDEVSEAQLKEEQLYSYTELEHDAAGPTLAMGLWRLKPLPPSFLKERSNLRVQICFAKAKAFGIKRIVHRVSFAYADLLNRRTTITWVHD